MWRYFVGFLGASIAVSLVCGLVNPVESFWVDAGMALGYALFVLWLGDGIFLRGIFLDPEDAERMDRLFAAVPHWRSNLVMWGVFWGSVATALTWTMAHYSESLWILGIPILVFGGVLWFLIVRIRRITRGLAKQAGSSDGDELPD
jgi:hypothetical protein